MPRKANISTRSRRLSLWRKHLGPVSS
jgi:hypothetical protein